VLGWLYWRTGSVWPGIAMHFANNTLSTVMASIYGQDAKTADIFGQGWQLYAVVAALTVATIALLWLFNRKSKEL
jgi:membrane protease YdiL (CAAX protease family)